MKVLLVQVILDASGETGCVSAKCILGPMHNRASECLCNDAKNIGDLNKSELPVLQDPQAGSEFCRYHLPPSKPYVKGNSYLLDSLNDQV